MRAIVFNKRGLHFQTDYPVPQPGKEEALIKVTHAGICKTDIEIAKGYMGFEGIPGHEFVGIVERCKQKDLTGKRVVGEINIACGTCSFCKNRMRNLCPRRSVLGILNKNGVFAEYITLPIKNLHQIPDTVSDEEAVFVEPLAAAFEIIQQVEIEPDERVCVLGDGKLGLLVGQVLSLTGCKLVVVGKHQEKLSILKKRRVKTKLVSDFDETEFDIVIDCTGSLTSVETAIKIVRARGKIILKTTTAKKTTVNLNDVVIKELTLIGSRCGPFPPAIRAIENGGVDVQPLISRSFYLKDGVKAFKYASRRGVLKVILKMT